MRFTADARRIAALLALLLLSCWLWAQLNDTGPRDALPDATGLRFPCLSYAPFRQRGHAPTDRHLMIPVQAIERDLRQIAQLSGCVRLYGTANGLDQVPAVARRLGLRVWLGAWVGSDPVLARRELERALQLAEDYPDVVDRLIVGSEVLLRRELPLDTLAALLDEARARAAMPVAYADVWEFWLRHADALRAHVDEAVIHILPYWEDHPVAVDDGVAHVLHVYEDVSRRLAPLPVVIGETGWPSAGRRRDVARAGTPEQSRFLRELLLALQTHPLPLNVIEAFDQPWKVTLEGVAGASWGVFSADGLQRYRPDGPVPRHPPWITDAAMMGGAAVLLLTGLLTGLLRGHRPGWRCAVLLSSGAAIGALCLMQVRELALLAIDGQHAAWRLAVLGGSLWWAAAETLALAAATGNDRANLPAPFPPAWLLRALRVAGLLGAMVYALWLLWDGRYLDLAWPALAAPVVPYALQRLFDGPTRRPPWTTEVAAGLLAVAAIAITWSEGWRNTAALAVTLLLLLQAWCWLRVPLRPARRR